MLVDWFALYLFLCSLRLRSTSTVVRQITLIRNKLIQILYIIKDNYEYYEGYWFFIWNNKRIITLINLLVNIIYWICCKEVLVKVGLSPFEKISVVYFIESPLKMMKNDFYFILKALFILKIFKFLSWLLGHLEKTTWLER